ncbi:unnamed protein product [Psylliodes chrysocephalus]|uniref:Uncharacterized protein n=1 Tax=Psylliodes chrysocephalus TaxID=3402493 RepID=A0A9P0D0A9_9CUCU|nr:unnamed protein product [Psylliodes chrysocephala]
MYNIEKPQKAIQDRCKYVSNEKSKLRCSQFTEDDRKSVFKQFWKMSWSEKQVFITTQVESKHTERSRNRRKEETSRRTCIYIFSLKKADRTKIRVCKTLFANTLAIKQWTINNRLKQNLNISQQEKKKKEDQTDIENNQTEINKKKSRELRRNRLKEFF